jgi:CRAL/TRIO domain
MILRFARCSPGPEKFNEKSAFKVMQKFNPRYLSLKAVDLEKQLMSKTLFVVPGLKSSEGHDVFYMRPSRYFRSETSTESIIDNLAYCMQTMVEKEKACTEGIAFVANLEDWTMGNFSVSYCLEFMKMLQGRSPVRVRMFIIANPPSWFNVIWKIMKSMLASDFRKKVKMIPQSQIGEFLMEGYEAFLYDDMKGGQANTQEMINDFLIHRKEIEG